MLLRPRALRPGDLVAVAALSGGVDEEEAPLLAAGITEIERMGFRVRVAPLVERSERWWWAAATPAEMAAELNGLLRDPEVRAVFALTGGRMTMAYLDLVDLDAVRADPKPVVGFSDLAALQLALHARTGVVGVSGDLVTFGFGERDGLDAEQRERLRETYRGLLTGETLGDLPRLGTWECWRSGRAEGPLPGGILNRLVRLQATPFAFAPERFDGAILFWEEVGVETSQLWSDLQVLRLAGVLDRIAGMVVGPTSTVGVTDGGPPLRDVVLEALGDRTIPVLGNADIGHAPPNVPLPLGIRAELDADRTTLSLLEPALAG